MPGRRILVVCTGNVCRSPVAAALLRRQLLERPDGRAGIGPVTSAGTLHVRQPVDPEAVAAARELGVDISSHVPRAVTTEMLATDGADLILTMERRQLRDLVVMSPACRGRTFTLREIVRRSAGADGAPGERAGEWEPWVASVAAGRRPDELLAADRLDDIPDPFGGGIAAVRRTAGEIAACITALVSRMP